MFQQRGRPCQRRGESVFPEWHWHGVSMSLPYSAPDRELGARSAAYPSHDGQIPSPHQERNSIGEPQRGLLSEPAGGLPHHQRTFTSSATQRSIPAARNAARHQGTKYGTSLDGVRDLKPWIIAGTRLSLRPKR